MPGTLYIVATPIGNLADMTPRAVEVLSGVDMIAAEDTRHSRGLLSHFGIRTPLFSCHKFNEDKRGDFFVSALLGGKDIALISDAGTPSISDPGHKLVGMAVACGIAVVAVCGANAIAAALSVSGFDASRFVFLGFMPRTVKEQAEVWDMLASGDITGVNKNTSIPAVFYESPLRIHKTLGLLEASYPTSSICLCNDLTKKFERTYRGTPAQVLAELSQNPSAKKGEYTGIALLPVIAKPENTAPTISLEAQLVDIMINNNCSLKDAANMLHETQKNLRIPGGKKAIYAATLRLKELWHE
ncbi:MAG: 16S rRNA (cytidine(1402)-2'-O)-methyltransferase [Defluviitaleaceae bacterium]|nr:16S rRNA (cytidine(1402)-2'-O)-methyltransferase [Defluviitaleaceae bacterium]